jgi:hypothetical protein
MPSPWVSVRHEQLIPVNKAVNEKEQLEKRREEKKKNFYIHMYMFQSSFY